jgi:hypothetical protein
MIGTGWIAAVGGTCRWCHIASAVPVKRRPAAVGTTGADDETAAREFGMLIDCDTCTVRGPACGDCVVTVLLGAPPSVLERAEQEATLDLDPAEQAAIAVLAGSGLVPPLRLVQALEAQPCAGPGRGGRAAEAG